MKYKKTGPRFVVVERDPFISMDIRDIIHEAYGAEPVILDDAAALPCALVKQRRPTVVISSTAVDPGGCAIKVKSGANRAVAVVLIDTLSTDIQHDWPDTTVVRSPFSSQTLLSGIKSACASLQSIQS